MTLGLFVTGTDTGVGKTRVAAGLCRAFGAGNRRVAAMKPVASGCRRTPQGLRNDDAEALLAAANVRMTYQECNPYAFEAPIAPHIAARAAGTPIDFDTLDRAFERLALRSDVLMIEGAGGWLVPLDADRNFADLAARWRLQVILVVGMRLGCLNHALLSAESIERRGLVFRGWVANAIDPDFAPLDDNIAELKSRLAAPCLAMLPFDREADVEAVATAFGAHALGAEM